MFHVEHHKCPCKQLKGKLRAYVYGAKVPRSLSFGDFAIDLQHSLDARIP